MKKLLILFITLSVANDILSQNVGIGTATPGAKLQINHKALANSPSITLFDSTGGTGSEIRFVRQGVTIANNFGIHAGFTGTNTTSYLRMMASGQPGITMNGNGHVVVGGGSPNFVGTFSVQGDANFTGNILMNGDAGQIGQPLVSNSENFGAPAWYPNAYFLSDGKIGLGTSAPSAKLQINHRNTSTSPSLILYDSAAGTGSRILFSKESAGNTFSIVSTNDALAANSSLDFRTTLSSGLFLRGDRRVGVNNISPVATLHIGGGAKINDTLNVGSDLNIEGNLKINGNTGTANQVLVSNGASNSPSWQNLEQPMPASFQNFIVFEQNIGFVTWTVPANVTKVIFEGWSGGGFPGYNLFLGYSDQRGGGGGAYCKVMVNVVAGQQFTIHVPNAQTGSFTDKDSLVVQRMPVSGLTDKLVLLNADSSANGKKIRNTGIMSNGIFIDGAEGGFTYSVYGHTKGLGFGGVDYNYYSLFLAAGGNAPFGGSGGIGGYNSYRESSSFPGFDQYQSTKPGSGKTPGGGAPAGSGGGVAGAGRLIIYY